MLNLHILYNGNIITLDDQQPRVSALAILHGRIVALGSDDEILALAGAGSVKQNLDGKTVIPGLVDSHIHWEWTARSLHQVNLFEVPTKALAVERVGVRAAELNAGEWVLGYGWIQDLWDDKAFPTAADLDSVSFQQPVFLRAKSGHAAWINTVTMRSCGIYEDTPDPEGGQIMRDKNGQPTGILLEKAMDLVARRIPRVSPEQLAGQMLDAQDLALAAGLTGIHDFDNPSAMVALQILRERGSLSLRVVKQINKAWLPDAIDLGVRWGYGDDWIRFGGLKLFADGALGPRTALMVEPYEGEPENFGIVVTEKEEIARLVSQASEAGLPSSVHAIGDRAVHDVLDVIELVRREEYARGEARGTRRHRIEHVQLLHPDDKRRLSNLGIIASMQPLHATSDYEMADAYWGERTKMAYNARTQLDQGVVCTFGSDSPIESFEPLKGIHAAVTRRRADGSPGPEGWYPELRLTVDEALRGYTIGAAYAAGTEAYQGKLATGYLADLVVLDRDLYHIPPHEIQDIKVQGTMVDGLWRFGGV